MSSVTIICWLKREKTNKNKQLKGNLFLISENEKKKILVIQSIIPEQNFLKIL